MKTINPPPPLRLFTVQNELFYYQSIHFQSIEVCQLYHYYYYPPHDDRLVWRSSSSSSQLLSGQHESRITAYVARGSLNSLSKGVPVAAVDRFMIPHNTTPLGSTNWLWSFWWSRSITHFAVPYRGGDKPSVLSFVCLPPRSSDKWNEGRAHSTTSRDLQIRISTDKEPQLFNYLISAISMSVHQSLSSAPNWSMADFKMKPKKKKLNCDLYSIWHTFTVEEDLLTYPNIDNCPSSLSL